MREKKSIRKELVFGTMLILIALVLAAVPLNVTAQPTEEWVARYDGPAHYLEYVNGMEMDSEGNIYLATQSFGIGTLTDFTLVSYDPDGNLRWVNRYNGPNDYYESPWGMTMGPDETIYMVGISGHPSIDGNCITAAYDTDGNRLWLAIYESPEGYFEKAVKVAVDPGSGNVYITGWISTEVNNVLSSRDILTIAYDSSGNQLWMARHVSPGSGYSYGSDIKIHPTTGNILVAGARAGIGTALDSILIAYDSAGNELWFETYDNPLHTDDWFDRIDFDPAGNIYMIGTANANFVNGDILIIAYDSAGNLLWFDTYNGPASGNDMGSYLVVDYPDRLYISGHSDGVGTNSDWVIMAYDLLGNQLWTARYDGPGHGMDWAWELEISHTGDVYVTGFSVGVGTSFDSTTLAYDSNGNLLWEMRYDGPAGGNDRSWFIAFDPLDNFYVVGSSTGIGTSLDAALVKYSVSNEEALGNLIAFVNSMDIHAGIKNSFVSKLENVQKMLDKGNEKAALNLLEAFMNEVEAQRGNKLTEVQANQLIYGAQWIIDSF